MTHAKLVLKDLDIQISSSRGKETTTYDLVAETEQEALEWAKAIRSAIDSLGKELSLQEVYLG